MDLEETNRFIQKNKHLPGVPSAKEVMNEGGVELGEMNRILLEKVEELTLLLIDQNQKILVLEKEVKALKDN